jgi:DNA-binding response OmpR family regulator
MTTQASILIAEDDPTIENLIVEVLAEEGYVVHNVGNGTVALAMLLTRLPDLALIDLHLPGLNGLEIVKAARIWGIDVPIVIVTANTRAIDALTATGVSAILLKPFDLDDLLTCVAQHIRRRPPLPTPC